MAKMRLDLLLVERGLVQSRASAQALIMAGKVRVDGAMESKAGTSVDAKARLEVAPGPQFVSRGGEKLAAALAAFDIVVGGRTCADVGASTGGFTDCLLQHGAAKVYAIDVGKGGLHWKLRTDPRVVIVEETNARYLDRLPEGVSLVTMDASFISLRLLLPVVKNWLAAFQPEGMGERKAEGDQPAPRRTGGDVVALIKPQFEAGRKDVSRGDGVIRDPEIHRQVLLEVLHFAESLGFGLRGLIRSPLLGPKGNVEFLTWLDLSSLSVDMNLLIEEMLRPRAGS